MEEYLFFTQFKFHKTKLVFHRAAMRAYKTTCCSSAMKYIMLNVLMSITTFVNSFLIWQSWVFNLYFSDVTDNWLDKRIRETALQCQMEIEVTESPLFLNSREELRQYHKRSKRFFKLISTLGNASTATFS